MFAITLDNKHKIKIEDNDTIKSIKEFFKRIHGLNDPSFKICYSKTIEKRNYKNELKEFCDKERIQKPQYTSLKVVKDGLFWKSYINLNFEGSNNSAVSGLHIKKIDAEHEVALIMLNFIKMVIRINTLDFEEDYIKDLFLNFKEKHQNLNLNLSIVFIGDSNYIDFKCGSNKIFTDRIEDVNNIENMWKNGLVKIL